MAKYIDADRLIKELYKRLKNVRDYMNSAGMTYKGPKYFKAQGKESAYDALLNIIDSLQQEPDNNLEEAAEKYRRVSCNAAMKPNIDGPIPEYGGNVKTAFIAGAQWMKEQMMNDAVEGTLAGQLLSSLTENGKQMVITVPRNKFPSNPKTKSIKLIIVKEN